MLQIIDRFALTVNKNRNYIFGHQIFKIVEIT